MAKWSYFQIDNGGKRQAFTIAAPDKMTAIKKGQEKARKAAKGDVITWECRLSIA